MKATRSFSYNCGIGYATMYVTSDTNEEAVKRLIKWLKDDGYTPPKWWMFWRRGELRKWNKLNEELENEGKNHNYKQN